MDNSVTVVKKGIVGMSQQEKATLMEDMEILPYSFLPIFWRVWFWLSQYQMVLQRNKQAG